MKKFKVPHSYVIISMIILLAAVFTFVFPAGKFDRYTDEATGRTLVDASSYHEIEETPATLFSVLESIPKGMTASADVIFMVLLYGGAFGVINSTGVVELGIKCAIRKLKKLHFC